MNLAICEDNPQHYEIICSILRDLRKILFRPAIFLPEMNFWKQFPILHPTVLIPLF